MLPCKVKVAWRRRGEAHGDSRAGSHLERIQRGVRSSSHTFPLSSLILRTVLSLPDQLDGKGVCSLQPRALWQVAKKKKQTKNTKTFGWAVASVGQALDTELALQRPLGPWRWEGNKD